MDIKGYEKIICRMSPWINSWISMSMYKDILSCPIKNTIISNIISFPVLKAYPY
jgi:hypothetical protein